LGRFLNTILIENDQKCVSEAPSSIWVNFLTCARIRHGLNLRSNKAWI
jgi:hypothetical protein